MWNLKNKINEQTKQTIDPDGKGIREHGVKGEGIEKYKQVITKQSWGCKVQHREYSQ